MMEDEAKPFNLLSLPRELRDHIYQELPPEHRGKPPPNPSSAGERIRGLHDNMFVANQTILKYHPIIYVCHQIRDELRENATKDDCKAPTAALDIMAKGYLFYPTWIVLPAVLKRGEHFNLDVNLRIFSTEAFRSNDGW